ncbi:MAG TPA: glycosyltransferase [Polyangia bacterium]|nr:glycosyltransferase [Polyangia bacterium]
MKRSIDVVLVSSVVLAIAAPFIWGVSLGGVLAIVGAVVLVNVLAWHRAQSRAIAPHVEGSVALVRYPSVTVVRPVRGADVGARENFTAALDTGYPGEVETLFVFDDEKDPGLPIAREVVKRHRALGRRGRADVIVAGAPPAGRTGKLNAMSVGARMARGELIAFGDSDTRPDRNVLRRTVETLVITPGAGSAFAPILVHQPPRAAGDVLYALMQNALYAPLAAWASGARRELPFIMGQLMVFKREALTAIGGVECADGQLVDDMYIGKRVHQAGYKNVMSRAPLHIATGGMTLRQFLPVYRRWMAFSRNGLPLSFTWRQWLQGGEFWIALIAALIALASGRLVAAIFPSLALIAMTVSLLALQRGYGGAKIPLRWAWAPFGFYLLAPFVLLANELKRRVVWRGRVYAVNGAAALAVRPSAPPVRAHAA